MQVIPESLKKLALGQPQKIHNLAVFPLLGPGVAAPGYVTLRRALAAGTASIREVSEGGSVPQLRFENLGQQPVLILDGEELVGAKQNRIANVTILAPASETITIPVSCVEAGRWAYSRPHFEDSPQAMYSRGRASKTARVSDELRVSGQRAAGQSEVWQEISAKARRMAVDSPSEAMADIYDRHAASVEDYVGAITAVPGQLGALFAIGGRIGGLDVFDHDATLAEMLGKLVRSYAIDALESRHRDRESLDAAAASGFIERLAGARVESYPGVGLGTDVRLTGPGVAAGGLVHEERLVHLAGFLLPAGSQTGPDDDRGLQRALHRRRRVAGV